MYVLCFDELVKLFFEVCIVFVIFKCGLEYLFFSVFEWDKLYISRYLNLKLFWEYVYFRKVKELL